jgi:hypothetical protein
VITAMRPAVTSVGIFSAARIESAAAGSIAMGVIQKANTIAEYSSPGAPPALLSIHEARPPKSPVRTLSDVLRRLQPTVVAAE